MSTTCPGCHKAIKIEDLVVKSYIPVVDLQTCGTIKIAKRGRVAAQRIQCGGGIVCEGAMEGSIETDGEVHMGPKAYWKGKTLQSRALKIAAGAKLIGVVSVPWARLEPKTAATTTTKTKKAATTKVAAAKTVTKKKVATAKVAAAKTVTKKKVATARVAAAKTVTKKKVATAKVAAKKAVTKKKTAARKVAAKKAPAKKKTAARKVAAKKAPTKKKTATSKAAAKKKTTGRKPAARKKAGKR
ncbi:MAG: bactofilin family protein [Planctomycetota bacterium]|jgi:cytoskeletal protein CcmA (bactofilin family)